MGVFHQNSARNRNAHTNLISELAYIITVLEPTNACLNNCSVDSNSNEILSQ